MLFPENEPCTVCLQTGRSTPFHTTTYPEHHYHPPFTLRRCDSCGLLFNSPRLDGTELARLYGRNYYFFLRKDEREFNRIVAMYQRTIRLIDPAQISQKRSIDIGCGRGYFPAVLRELGWNATGVEISPDAAEYGRSTFGLDVFTGTIEDYARSSDMKQFPLVTAIDVIEHVPSPDAFIAAAVRVVEAGGRLIIDTPNAASANIALKGTSWKGFNPFHIYLFTIEQLTRLLSRHGMTVESSFSYGNTPTPLDPRDRAILALRKTHLIAPVVAAYFRMKKLTIGSGGDPRPHVKSAAERIRTEPAYTATPDASQPLAPSKAGDNIVVFARKP